MINTRFFIILSFVISTIILLGPTLEVRSLDIHKSNANQLNATKEPKEVENVIEKILSYVSAHRLDDPMIEVEPHIFVKKSNLKGIVIEDKTYYYSLFPHASFDPVSVGKVSKNEVTIIYDDEKATIPVIIYTIN